MGSARKSHENWIELIYVAQSVATHSSRLQPAISCMSQLQHWCTVALDQIYGYVEFGMKAQETTIEPHDIVYYIPRTQTLFASRAKGIRPSMSPWTTVSFIDLVYTVSKVLSDKCAIELFIQNAIEWIAGRVDSL